MFDEALKTRAARLLTLCQQKAMKIATAESCTGGLIAALLTEIPGASDVFRCGFVTYANETKTAMIGVSPQIISRHGAVSEEVAAAMARGAVDFGKVDMAVSVTGIAGPGGGSEKKPVGLVYIGVASRIDVKVEKHQFAGDRNGVRLASVNEALAMLADEVNRYQPKAYA